jgi:hypothetical protein
MTFKEKLQKEHPEKVHKRYCGGCSGCPRDYGYEKTFDGGCPGPKRFYGSYPECEHCWNREITGTEGLRPMSRIEEWGDIPWPKKNPHLTEHAKAEINAKNILDHKHVDVLNTLTGEATLGNVQYDLQKAIYKMSLNRIYVAPKVYIPDIKQVIFNDPATIVIWADGEKTVVKCQNGEPYDPEKGLAMAITKRALGNKGNYFDEIKKWTKKYKPKEAPVPGISSEQAIEGFKKLAKAAKIGRRG